MASIWWYKGQYKCPCRRPGTRLKDVSIIAKRHSGSAHGWSFPAKLKKPKDYKEPLEPYPLIYTWRVSANGRFTGQGSPTIDVVFNCGEQDDKVWVEVEVSNSCSLVRAYTTFPIA